MKNLEKYKYNKEQKSFLRKGYSIFDIKKTECLKYIEKNIKEYLYKITKKKFNLNDAHKYIPKNKLNTFIKEVDYLYITIDLDGFSSAYAPGVSAPSPLGFTPHFAYKVLAFLFKSKKVISLDIAELNPDFDIDENTANLAAKIIDYMILNT